MSSTTPEESVNASTSTEPTTTSPRTHAHADDVAPINSTSFPRLQEQIQSEMIYFETKMAKLLSTDAQIDEFRKHLADLQHVLGEAFKQTEDHSESQDRLLTKYRNLETKRLRELERKYHSLLGRWREMGAKLRHVLQEKEKISNERDLLLGRMRATHVKRQQLLLRNGSAVVSEFEDGEQATLPSSTIPAPTPIQSLRASRSRSRPLSTSSTIPSRFNGSQSTHPHVRDFFLALLDDLLECIVSVMNAEAGRICLYDVKQHEFVTISTVPRTSTASTDKQTPTIDPLESFIRISANEGIPGVVFSTGRPRNMTRAYQSGGGGRDRGRQWRDVGSVGGAVIGTTPDEIRRRRRAGAERERERVRSSSSSSSSSSTPSINGTSESETDGIRSSENSRFNDSNQKCVICYPLVSRRSFTSIGIIELSNKRGSENFTREDEAIVASFSVVLSRIVQSVLEIGLYRDLFGAGLRSVDVEVIHERMKIPPEVNGSYYSPLVQFSEEGEAARARMESTQLRFRDLIIPSSSSIKRRNRRSLHPSASVENVPKIVQQRLSVLHEFGALIPPHIEEFVKLLHDGWRRAVEDCAAYEKSNAILREEKSKAEVDIRVLHKTVTHLHMRIERLEAGAIREHSRALLRTDSENAQMVATLRRKRKRQRQIEEGGGEEEEEEENEGEVEEEGEERMNRVGVQGEEMRERSQRRDRLVRMKRMRGVGGSKKATPTPKRMNMTASTRSRRGGHPQQLLRNRFPNLFGKKALSSSLPVQMGSSPNLLRENSPRLLSFADASSVPRGLTSDEIYSEVFLRLPVPSLILSSFDFRVLRSNRHFIRLMKARSHLDVTGELFTRFCMMSRESMTMMFRNEDVLGVEMKPLRRVGARANEGVAGRRAAVRVMPIQCDLKVKLIGKKLGRGGIVAEDVMESDEESVVEAQDRDRRKRTNPMGYFRIDRRTALLQEGPFYLICCLPRKG